MDKPQQTVINMINVVVQDAKKLSNPSDIEFAESVVKKLKENNNQSESFTIRKVCSSDTCTIIRCEGNNCTKTVTESRRRLFSESTGETGIHTSSISITIG